MCVCGGAWPEHFVIVLRISCKPAIKGGFRSPLDDRAQASNVPPPSFLALSTIHAVHAAIWKGKGEVWGTLGKLGARYLLGKLFHAHLPPSYHRSTPCHGPGHIVPCERRPLELCRDPAGSLVRKRPVLGPHPCCSL